MDIQAEKLEIMRMILDTDNPHIIDSIKKIFKKQAKKDFWDTLPQSQKDDILKGIQEIEDGDIIDYDLKNLYGAWEDTRDSDEIIKEIRNSHIDSRSFS
jgi:hypothetical protein